MKRKLSQFILHTGISLVCLTAIAGNELNADPSCTCARNKPDIGKNLPKDSQYARPCGADEIQENRTCDTACGYDGNRRAGGIASCNPNAPTAPTAPAAPAAPAAAAALTPEQAHYEELHMRVGGKVTPLVRWMYNHDK